MESLLQLLQFLSSQKKTFGASPFILLTAFNKCIHPFRHTHIMVGTQVSEGGNWDEATCFKRQTCWRLGCWQFVSNSQNTAMTSCIETQYKGMSSLLFNIFFSHRWILKVFTLKTANTTLSSQMILKSCIKEGLTEVFTIMIFLSSLHPRIRSSQIDPLVNNLHSIFYFNTLETWASSVLANLPRTLGWLSAKAFLQAYWKRKYVINK